ncbi:MAG: CapA family protein [Crocinitomicaceae bacterium]
MHYIIRYKLLLVIAIGAFYSCIPFESRASQNRKKKVFRIVKTYPEDSVAKKGNLLISAVGDIMMGTNFPNESYLPPVGLDLLRPMRSYLGYGDICFGNLEGTILNQGGIVKKCDDSTKCYAFRQPEYTFDFIKKAGFNLLSVANNHMGDFGEIGRANTLQVLKKNGVKFAGLERCPWDTLTIKGQVVGFIAFAPNTECLPIEKLDFVSEAIKELDKIADILVVSFHGGAEGSKHNHVTRQTEIFYDEDRGNVYEFARTAIDAGADVVLGHGPHVTRAVDLYKGKFIAYSMGNFCTYARFNLKGSNGFAPLFQLEIDREGNLVQGKVISTKQIGEGGPILDADNNAWEEIKSLTLQDIPEAELVFKSGGIFYPKKN